MRFYFLPQEATTITNKDSAFPWDSAHDIENEF